jgi:iron(III) transport system substrate-binding protein
MRATFGVKARKLSAATLCVCMVLAAGALSAAAQSRAMTEIATYQGADRGERLIAGAKREREVTFYTSVLPEDVAALAAAFEKRYGVKVRSWRADAQTILQRTLTESQSGRNEVDVLHASAGVFEAMHRENLLQQVNSPNLADLVPQGIPAHREWAPVAFNVIVQSYNTNLVTAAVLPKSYRDLLLPQWKGKLGIEVDDADWLAQVVTELGEAEGLQLFREIATRNGFSVRKGHSLLDNLVIAGDVALALTTYRFAVDQAKAEGAPIDWFVIPPLIGRTAPVAVSRNASHPHAALLFYDFLLSDAQLILAGRQYDVASRKIETPFSRLAVRLIDPGMMLDSGQKWQDLYKKTIVNPSR